VDGGVVEEVRQFSYLGNVLDSEGRVERAIRARVATARRKWREISGLLVNKLLLLLLKGERYMKPA
jgi:hypothetical protein